MGVKRSCWRVSGSLLLCVSDCKRTLKMDNDCFSGFCDGHFLVRIDNYKSGLDTCSGNFGKNGLLDAAYSSHLTIGGKKTVP